MSQYIFVFLCRSQPTEVINHYTLLSTNKMGKFVLLYCKPESVYRDNWVLTITHIERQHKTHIECAIGRKSDRSDVNRS